MDDLGNLIAGQNTSLVIFAFLQADYRNAEYEVELLSLRDELPRDNNYHWPRIDDLGYGNLETDGHLPSSITASLDDIQPSLELHRNHEQEAAIQQVAEELREIAAQLEHSVVAQATQNLRSNLIASPSYQWRWHLEEQVDRLMKGLMSLEHLPQERVIMALTLTLVKGVCEQTPRLLRCLFTTALQYLTSFSWGR